MHALHLRQCWGLVFQSENTCNSHEHDQHDAATKTFEKLPTQHRFLQLPSASIIEMNTVAVNCALSTFCLAR